MRLTEEAQQGQNILLVQCLEELSTMATHWSMCFSTKTYRKRILNNKLYDRTPRKDRRILILWKYNRSHLRSVNLRQFANSFLTLVSDKLRTAAS